MYTPLNGMQIGAIAGLAFAPTVVIQIIKVIVDAVSERKNKNHKVFLTELF